MQTGYQIYADGSVLIDWGNTRVLCAASLEEKVPEFRKESGGGWITAEYNMLPRSTSTRKPRRPGGRETEIQRLIGRALRAAVNLADLGPRTITIDCDVLQADGGTRVASITGGFVALVLAMNKLARRALIPRLPPLEPVAAVSVGLVDGQVRLDLPYEEDCRAEVDMTLVMTASGRFIELQGAAEHGTFDLAQMNNLIEVGRQGLNELCAAQKRTLAACGIEL